MSTTTSVTNILKAISEPAAILYDWATEPLKRWANNRAQANLDRDVEREIKKQTGVSEVQSRLRREEAEFNTDLQIKMQTEIDKIKAQTEVWKKDQDLRQAKEIINAVEEYQVHLQKLHDEGLEAIGTLTMDLRVQAGNLIHDSEKKFKALMDEAYEQYALDMERADRFNHNKAIMDSMIGLADKKTAKIIEACGEILNFLAVDLKQLANNIDTIAKDGQKFLEAQSDDTRKILMSSFAQKPAIEDRKGKINMGEAEDAKIIQ